MSKRVFVLVFVCLLTLVAGAATADDATAASSATEPSIDELVQAYTAPFATSVSNESGAFGCPSSSSFSCNESCFAQRSSCIANCGPGDPDCVEICVLCYRECVFFC